MIVDMLNTHLTGGAALAARRLHDALRSAGIRSRFWHSSCATGDARVAHARPLAWPRPRLSATVKQLRLHWDKHGLARRQSGWEIFSDARQIAPTPYDSNLLQGDILHLHWVARWLDYGSFFGSVPDHLPIVWTLHDMNPFTGGCHYSNGCEAFSLGCAYCPQLTRRAINDPSRISFDLKRQLLEGKNLHVVTPSRWLTRQARRSPVLSAAKSIRTIPYGLDVQLFSPRNKTAARKRFNLSDECIVLGFGADSVEVPRKGTRLLLEALASIQTPRQVVGLWFGNGCLPARCGRVRLQGAGYLDDPRILATFYSAADLFVLPSLEDNLPQTGLEAMACGTPVVAFAVGGIPDFTHDGQTGQLAKRGDVVDLARQIEALADEPRERRRLGGNARTLIEESFAASVELGGYLDLYRELLSAQNAIHAKAA
jgi:glycosyltransferase involved in cell wall biosynthesis